MEPVLLAAVLGVFLIAGFVKGVVGLGLPTVSLAALTVFQDLPVAVALMVIPSAVTNIWQAIDGPHTAVLVRRFSLLLLASVVGVWISFGLLLIANPKAMTGLLGITLCVYCLLSLRRAPAFTRVRHERILSPAMGLATGALAGATGSLVMPVVPYLQALRLERDAMVQMMGLSFSVSTCAIGLAALRHGSYDDTLALISAAALVPALLGMKIGQRLRRGLSEVVFRRCLFIGLFIIGVRLVWKGFL